MASSSSGVNGPSSTTRVVSIVPTKERVFCTIVVASSTVTNYSLQTLGRWALVTKTPFFSQGDESAEHLDSPPRRQDLPTRLTPIKEGPLVHVECASSFKRRKATSHQQCSHAIWVRIAL
jgi:hypothetical protein